MSFQRKEVMTLSEELDSKSAPKIKKAATKIFKQKLLGYEEHLLTALKILIEKPRSWQAQSELIKALGVTGGEQSVTYLKALLGKEFEATILYKDLGFAICLLNDISHNHLEFVWECLDSKNQLLVSGICAAILYSGFVPENDEILRIVKSIEDIDDNEGQVITPRSYIAAACYKWPSEVTHELLCKCTQSSWSTLVEIANDSLAGKQSKYILI